MSTQRPERDNHVLIRGLSFTRGNRVLFDRVNMDIPRGRVTAIMGPRGSGKTTLLKLIGGQLRPEAGRIDVAGQDVHALGRDDLFALRKRLGVLFQSGALLTDLSVFDNVAFPLREHTALPEALIRQLVSLWLETVGLRCARDLMPAELSGGMERRVALARALVLDPDMILYDEPFTGQDPISMGVLVQLIRSVNDALGVTSIVVSHDVAEVLSIVDYAYVIADGEVVGRGTPEELRASRSPWIRQFVHALPDGPAPFHYPGADYAEELFADDRKRGRRRA
ncbi:MAG: ATP-binding cassette domain-containing protein [Halofilum sp. (in: g-proteobacteria)]